MALPKELGGQGKVGLATPEHLFAEGYAASFGGASVRFRRKAKQAQRHKGQGYLCRLDRPRDSGFGIAVKMRVEDPSIAETELDAFVGCAHEKICPYSHATRGNVEVTFDVIGAVHAINAQ